MKNDSVLVLIPLWNIIQIYFYSFVFGVWLFMKSVFRWMWSYNNVSSEDKFRDNPPGVLIDTDVGRHSCFKIKGVKLHYVETGSSGLPPVLLLHGFPDCWVSWRYQMEMLSASHHVWALDLLGCGDSDKPKGRNHYTPNKLLAQLKIILEAIAQKPPYRPATIIAHDLGGLLAWYLAHEYPELIDKLVIVSSPHPNVYWESLPSSGIFNDKWMWTAQIPYLPEYEAMKGDISLLDKCYPHLKSKTKNGLGALQLEAYKFVFSRRQDWTGPINYFRNLIFWRISESRGKVRVPILLVVGNKDSQVTLESIIRSSDRCNQVAVKIVEGAGHYPHQETYQEFNKLLKEMLLIEKTVENNNKSPLGLISVGTAKGLVGKVFNSVHLFT